ncbi:MAG: hypothetical protein J7M15_02050 [Anaerolineae bacterium]|nr:hypothetical protein [Anaerolineae bacterium]
MLAPTILILTSIAAGVALLWVFSKTSNQPAIRATKKRLQARLLELRLYADDPRVVFQAQKYLLLENLRYFLLMLRPALFATLPMVLLLVVLEGFYGHRALMPGEAAIVTVQMRTPLPDGPAPRLLAPDGVKVETPAVRDLDERQVSWRIRAEQSVNGQLRLLVAGREFRKRVAAGGGFRYLARRRVRLSPEWLLYLGEAPLDGDAVEWIEIGYPPGEVSIFGLRMHWLIWFLVISMAAALLLKGKFRVTV